jgi:hypothetical protein
LLPENNRIIHAGDRFLMCGTYEARQHMLRVVKNINLLESVLIGEEVPAGWLLRKLRDSRRNKNKVESRQEQPENDSGEQGNETDE